MIFQWNQFSFEFLFRNSHRNYFIDVFFYFATANVRMQCALYIGIYAWYIVYYRLSHKHNTHVCWQKFRQTKRLFCLKYWEMPSILRNHISFPLRIYFYGFQGMLSWSHYCCSVWLESIYSNIDGWLVALLRIHCCIACNNVYNCTYTIYLLIWLVCSILLHDWTNGT